MNSPLDIAERLRTEADDLLFNKGVDDLLKRQGEVYYGGSYALDLMAWPDIDLNVVAKECADPNEVAAHLASEFVLRKESVRVKFERDLHQKIPALPNGLYLGVKLDIGEWKTPWKLDIWIVDRSECDKTKQKVADIQKLLTPSNRKVILEWKQKLMTPQGRTPSLSGHWLYQAILVQKLEADEEILGFLRENGVSV